HGFGVLVHELEDFADVPVQFGVEAFCGLDGGAAPRPQTPMTGLEEMHGQLLLARKVFVQGRVGVAALPGDVTNAGALEPLLAEQLHGRAEDLSLGRRIVLANVEGKRLTHAKRRLANANLPVKSARSGSDSRQAGNLSRRHLGSGRPAFSIM